MTGSPFSNVIGHNPGEDSTFQDVESTQVGDTTDQDRSVAGQDTDSEPSVPVEVDAQGDTKVSGEDETAGQTDQSGLVAPQ